MSNWKRLGLASVVAATSLTASLSFPAQSFAHDPMYPKLNVYFRLGAFGEFEGRAGNGPVQRGGMEPGFGGGLELEVPLNPYLALGGAFEAHGVSNSRMSESNNVSLDFFFVPRVRIPFGTHPWHGEVYFALPIGPTVSLPHDRYSGAMLAGPLDTGFGVAGGGRVGFRSNVNDIVGFFVDLGPMLHYVEYPRELGGASFNSWDYQFVVRAGGSFGFGGG